MKMMKWFQTYDNQLSGYSGFPHLHHLSLKENIWQNKLQMCENVFWWLIRCGCSPRGILQIRSFWMSSIVLIVSSLSLPIAKLNTIHWGCVFQDIQTVNYNFSLKITPTLTKIHYKKSMNILYHLMQRKTKCNWQGDV